MSDYATEQGDARSANMIVLKKVIAGLWAALEKGEATMLEITTPLLDAMDQQAKLMDLYPPERIVIVDDERSEPDGPVDPAVVRAFLASKRQAREAGESDS